ncbi:diguanylate cyclase [Enterovibrio norvegicus]|nr:diguanylate cyclase [Enterovibrio norvegicus]OEF55964.1 diguanylate cyclase [Enterovibrio norvegicus]PMI32467.1 diguanylate cyclase [Enterovibrio norvegicus]PMI37961.1 diguanylate cyclase [Enterovibrio norvegicus]PMN56586.1 diguanylate cyclase [Enterovibrio norvegicus]
MLKKLFKLRRSIQTQLTVLVLGLSLIFAVLSMSVQVGINYSHTVDWTKSSLEKRVGSTISVLNYAISKQDNELLNQQLISLASMPYVKNALLVSNTGTQRWAYPEDAPLAEAYFSRYSISDGTRNAGFIEVYLDLNAIESSAITSASSVAMVYLLEAFVIALLLLFIVQRTFTSRMKTLAEHVDKIDLTKVGKLVLPDALIKCEDEIGQVSNSVQALYQRVRADFIEKKLEERTLRQHKTLLAEEVNARTLELDWQNKANKLLADLSLRLLKGHKTDVENDVRASMSRMASLLETDHIFWLAFDYNNVQYRASYPEFSDEPDIDFTDMYKLKRWLMDVRDTAIIDTNNMSDHAVTERQFLERVGIHSLAMFPLTDGRKSFGLLVATNNHCSLRWNENKDLLLKRFATMLSELTIRERDHVAMTELQEELILANERLRVEAETDELTRLLNRRPFRRIMNTALYDAVDEKASITIMMIDIDHFKAYNDIYGHLQGDRVLTYVARAMNQVATASNATIARFGGEEFAFLLRDADLEQSKKVAWQLCQSVRDLSISHQGSKNSGIITVSIGGVICTPDGETQPNQLLETADQRLYKAKRAGRNRAEVKELDLAPLPSEAFES